LRPKYTKYALLFSITIMQFLLAVGTISPHQQSREVAKWKIGSKQRWSKNGAGNKRIII